MLNIKAIVPAVVLSLIFAGCSDEISTPDPDPVNPVDPVDPVEENGLTRITSSNSSFDDYFGVGFSLSETFIVAPSEADEAAYFYKYSYDLDEWVEQTVYNGDPTFGYGSAIDGRNAFVSHYTSTRGVIPFSYSAGAGTWTAGEAIIPFNGEQPFFGRAMAIDFEHAAICSSTHLTTYEKSSGEWQLNGFFEANGATNFCESVDMASGVMVVTADEEVWTYQQQDDGSWAEWGILTPEGDGADGDFYGKSIALDSSFIVVGSPRNGVTSPTAHDGTGAVYVYDTTNLVLLDKIVAQDLQSRDLFGWSVDVSDNMIIIGAPRSDADVVDSGAAYTYTYVEDVWTQADKYTSPTHLTNVNDAFGDRVQIGSDFGAIALHTDDGGNFGAIYAFEQPQN